MERPGWPQTLGFALVMVTAGAVVEQRKSERDSSEQSPPQVVAHAGAPAQAPAAPPHMDGASLLSAFYQKDIQNDSDSVESQVRRRALRILILTLPDPVSSHLDWSYDAGLESVRRAMEHSGYVIDRFWLPWRTTGDTAAARLGVADSLPGARWPGVMLFRARNTSDSSLVLVYVVGEVPTSGIHRLAMKEALEERRRLLPTNGAGAATDTLRVIGPAFSGSALSLRRALSSWKRSVDDGTVIEIVSGSASDATNLNTLTDSTLKMHFHATVHTSGWLAAAALRLVTQQLHILASEVAFLHEGTTQFGNSARIDSASVRVTAASVRDSETVRLSDDTATTWVRAPVDWLRTRLGLGRATPRTRSNPSQSHVHTGDTAVTPPLELAFPMSISGLRAQYARHPDRLVQPAREGGPAAEGPRLALDQREPASLSESPGFLSQLTAPSTELLLGQIERSLLAHHIRAVGILATDVRDQLFVADEIRKRMPDVQLFFYGSNVLLLRPDFQKALRGSLVVSTYPLVMENQFWDLTRKDRERLSFMSDESEGVFNAMLYQLGRGAAMMDYAPPLSSGSSYGPPTWLTVVGRDAMYPVALADEDTPADASTERAYLATRAALPVRSASEANAHPQQFMLTLFLMLAGFITSFVLLQRRTSRRVSPVAVFPTDMLGELQAQGSENREERQRAMRRASLLLHREMYVLLRQFSLFAGFSCAVLLLLRPRAHGVSTERWVLWILASGALFLTAVVFWRALVQSYEVMTVGRQHDIRVPFAGFFARKRDRLLSGIEWVTRLFVFLLGLAYFVVTLVFLWQVVALDSVKSALFFHRAVAVTSGVSPAAPLILAAVGFAAWCTWHLTRIALLAEPTVFEEFLLRQADSEAIRRSAMEIIRSLEMDASFQAREAHEWTRYAIKIRHKQLRRELAAAPAAGPEEGDAGVVLAVDDRAAGGVMGAGSPESRGFILSPDEMVQRAEAAAAVAWETWRDAQAEVKRAIDATPSVVWPSRDPLNDETKQVKSAATRADAYVARAKRLLDSARAEAARQASRETTETGPRRRLRELRSAIGAWTIRVDAWIDDSVSGSVRPIASMRAVRRRTMSGVSALADWYERPSHDFRAARRTPGAARELSDALFYLIPNGVALAVLVVVIGFAVWLALQFELSLEALVLSPLFRNATSFDVLFRFAALTLTGVTAWAVYRLTIVWTGIRRILNELQPDLVPSFVGLPPKLVRVTHLTLFGHASAADIKEVVDDRVEKMERAYAQAEAYLKREIRKDLGSEPRISAPVPRARPYHLDVHAYKDFERLHDTLEICRKHHLLGPETRPSASGPAGNGRASTNDQRAAATRASTMPTSLAPGATERSAWARSVADLYVVFVADYVDWVFQHMRYLASFLLVCLLVMVVLLSAYPFQPQSALRVIHTIILVVAVATLVLVIVQMNQQPVLSAIANTTPGAVSWNGRFVSTLATYGALPLLTLLSTQFPSVRDFLFSWIAPLIRAFAKG